jgi:hypothetical protein
MTDQLAHLPKLAPDVVQRARRLEFDDTKAFFLEQFAGRALGVSAGDHNVRL